MGLSEINRPTVVDHPAALESFPENALAALGELIQAGEYPLYAPPQAICTPMQVPRLALEPLILAAAAGSNPAAAVAAADYSVLCQLLAAGDWRRADRETLRLMGVILDRYFDGCFPAGALHDFPCADLQALDHLWTQYSHGQFGFSIQKRLYLECGGKFNGKFPGDSLWQAYGQRVDWHDGSRWINYCDVQFDVFAPQGHLPTCTVRGPVPFWELCVFWCGGCLAE